MPLSCGQGNWPVTYGVKQTRPIEDPRCAICIQKNCFICEHSTSVRDSMLETPKQQSILEHDSKKNEDSNEAKPFKKQPKHQTIDLLNSHAPKQSRIPTLERKMCKQDTLKDRVNGKKIENYKYGKQKTCSIL